MQTRLSLIAIFSLSGIVCTLCPNIITLFQINLVNLRILHSAVALSFQLDRLWDDQISSISSNSLIELSNVRSVLERATKVQARTRYGLAWIALLNSDYTSTITELESYLSEYPSDQMVHNILGVLYLVHDDQGRASTHFAQSDFSPSYLLRIADHYLASSEQLSLAGQPRAAAETSQKAKEIAWVAIKIMEQRLDASDAQAHYRLGYALMRFWRDKWDLDAALNAFARAQSLRPDYYLYYQAAGMTAYAKGDYATARSYLTRAISLSPTDTQSYYYLGMSSFQDGHYTDAARYFERAIQQGMISTTVFNHLGDTYVKLGDLQRARHSYEMALQYDPNDVYAIRQLGELK